MRRVILIIFLLVVAYVGYAGFSLRALIVGIQQRDAEAISDHVDFPSVRASLKEQLTSSIMQESIEAFEKRRGPGARIGAGLMAAVGPAMVGAMVDRFVTPAGIASLLSHEVESQNSSGAMGQNSQPETRQVDFKRFSSHVAILSPTRFRVADNEGMSIVFALLDWSWKIVDIRIPQSILEEKSAPLRE